MPFLEANGAQLFYTDSGDPDGVPVLLIAPGGMKSADGLWANMPWNPHDRLGDGYRIIGMDQRNAGQSTAPVSADDGWDTYTADQLAVLDHLGIDRFAIIGMCIGGPYVMGVVKAAGDRVQAAVLLQPIGLDDNHQAFYDMFDAWKADIVHLHPEADEATWEAFRSNMYDGEFMFNTSPDEVAAIDTPLLVAMGNDLYHPQSTSRAIAELAPNVTFVEQWKDDEHLPAADDAFRAFLAAHTAS
ncbi:MAG: alpha/beta hydrolase [Acidimicrobiales bacterium]